MLTLESSIDDQDDMPLLLLPSPPFLFLSFYLNSVPGDATCVDIPCSEANAHADIELPYIQEFLNTTCKPDGLDDTVLKKFLKQAMRSFLHNNQLWHQGPSQTHRLIIIPPKDRHSLLLQAHDQLGHKGFYSTCCTLTNHFW